MRSVREVAGGELAWRRPHASRQEYELRAGDEVVATLRWQKSAGSLALAETSDGQWTFKRQGFWHPRITARLQGTEHEVATFAPTWSGRGGLSLAGGPSFRWASANFWQSRWEWQDIQERPLVAFANSLLPKSGCSVEVPSGVNASWSCHSWRRSAGI